jgi:protoheme IX farnesyltransferase
MNVKSSAGQLEERRADLALSSDFAHRLVRHWSVFDFVTLTKPRVMMLAVFTALAGLSSAPVRLDPLATLAGVLAIAAGAGAAGVLNMWYDADIDAVMARTAMRPIRRGNVSRFDALILGLVLGGFAVVALEWRTQFSGSERRRTPCARAEKNRVRIPLLTVLLRQRSQDPQGPPASNRLKKSSCNDEAL